MSTELPDWIRVGAKVAEYSSRGRDGTVNVTTVEKLTATQVVCASGSRYRLGSVSMAGGLRVVGADDTTLLPLDNDRVRDVLARKRIDSIPDRIDKRLTHV